MILLIGSEKGGVGKSTIAVNLAAIRAGQGRSVLLIDTDQQGSAMQWAATRTAEKVRPIVTCVALYGKQLGEQVKALREKYDDIVIDAGGRDSVELRAAMVVADAIITPSMPSQFDVFSLATMDRLVAAARGFNSNLQAAILVNGAPTNPRTTDTADMLEYLHDMTSYTVLDTTVKSRKAYRLCARDGVATPELYAQDSKATQEMLDLAAEAWA